MIRILAISGSPVVDSSTDLLLRRIAQRMALKLRAKSRVQVSFVKLNDLEIVPCQACGEAPSPKYCFFDDDLTAIYKKLEQCDCLLFGSPIHFDTVSSPAKLFIDRCNCIRPADFNDIEPDHDFVKLWKQKRPGAIVLVGGKHAWFEGARRTIAGWFKWVEVVNEGLLTYKSEDFRRSGTILEDDQVLAEADRLANALASKVKTKRG